MMRPMAIAAVMALTLTALAQDGAQQNRLIVHEWGTFTAVYGADGTMMEWRPLIGDDLPKFVYSRASVAPTPAQRMRESKKETPSYQRMETPVLYFYTDKEMTVDVSVNFPKGLITEWYPRVRDFGPALSDGRMAVPTANGSLRWGKVKIFPQEQIRPALPAEGASNHYYCARETDSAFVRLCGVGDDFQKSEYEKFLFYRGVGNFSLPLAIKSQQGGRLTISNPGRVDIGHLFVITVKKDGKGKYLFLEKVAAGQSREVALDVSENWLTKEQLVRRISEELEECLVMEGLFRKEAKAMIKTWTDSYFETQGTRILYLLPEAMTNELLPLTLDPKPLELKRVLVARVDVMTPEQSQLIQGLIRELGGDSFEERDRAQKRIEALGRFAEPALKEAMRTAGDSEIRARAKKLLDELVARR